MAKTTQKFYTPKENYIQNGLYLLIFVIITFLCWPLAPKPNDHAVGILLPQGISYPSITATQVKVVSSQPPRAQLVGTINTKIYYHDISPEADQSNLEKNLNLAKELAAALGANVIVVNNIGRTIGLGPLNSFVVYAGAYHD